MEKHDETIRVYSTLNSLRENLGNDKTILVDEKYILQYHQSIDKLSIATTSNLEEFRVPENELKQTQSGGYFDEETGEHRIQYTTERFCEKTYLFSKLDALLSYFKIKYLSDNKEGIGFKPPTIRDNND